MTTPDHTLRPVIDELRAAQTPPGDHIHFPEVEWPEPGPDGGLVGVERGCATVAAPQPDDYDLVIEAAARYLLCPGTIRSRTDGQEHFIHARQIAFLYGVRMNECVVLPSDWDDPADERHRKGLLARAGCGELIALHPRADGDYKLPEPARPARPNGCHNRAPFLPIVAMPDGHSFPFRMAMDCQYTLSALGQADPRCAGCRWRANLPQTPASS